VAKKRVLKEQIVKFDSKGVSEMQEKINKSIAKLEKGRRRAFNRRSK